MTSPNNLTILLVEDHQFTRLGLKLSLEEFEDFTVIGEAEDGAEAVRLGADLKPAVVLMDIAMPVMDGIEAARETRKASPDTKIIMLTSHTSDEEIFAALGAGANGYCLKHISSTDLAAVIRTVAGGAVWLDPGIANRVLCHLATGEQNNSERKSAKAKSGEASLSPREKEVLSLVAEGMSNAQIAAKLYLGIETVKTHMRHIMEKLMVSDRTEAAVKAMREGLM